MRIIAADDEKLALLSLADAIRGAVDGAEVYCFLKPSEVLEFAEKTTCSIAFLDINMRGMDGLELAKRLKEITPDINIIFATGYSEYALDAVKLRASGYLMKPITADAVKAEIENLRNPVSVANENMLRVQTFGNFEVFMAGKPVPFNRSKSKELLAYLVDKQGTGADGAEIAAALWEDGIYDRSRQKQLRVFVSDLIKNLDAAGAKGVVIKNKRGLMVDKTKVDCDLYKFLDGDVRAINSYKGQYMYNYSWAEFTVGYLDMHN